MLAERQPRTLPNNTESNPREHMKAITLRSGKQLSSSIPITDDDNVVQVDLGRKDGDSKVMELEKVEGKKKRPLREYQPPIPYPTRLKQEKMPRYVKFLKEIFTNKRKLEDLAIVTLNEECSVILHNKLLEKKRDPGSFTVPCVIGDLTISNALADLGASINLMSCSFFTKLELGETKPTRMSIQLADRTVKYLRSIIEDVLVKVDKIIFLIDFVIMDMDGESNVPLILGRPFLATSRAIIDVCDGKLELKVGDETVTFDLNSSMRQSLYHDDTVFSVDLLDDVIDTQLQEILLDDPLQVALRAEDEHELSNESVLEQLAFLLANEPSKNTDKFVEIDRVGVQKLRPSHEEPPILELKELSKHLNYAYLDEDNRLSVILAVDLTPEEREMTLASLRKYWKTSAWKIADILRISPSYF
ncbi:uncharacterized protein LOC125369302 [Ricinus communis]|uniref:uncharacterized protein LOC125369302 n=1 Tax=Ricinus communis TaxID=3988 RepID=UPI00201A847E|nr:uncharacterized protein LOC125369302 [Ricinus communis]